MTDAFWMTAAFTSCCGCNEVTPESPKTIAMQLKRTANCRGRTKGNLNRSSAKVYQPAGRRDGSVPAASGAQMILPQLRRKPIATRLGQYLYGFLRTAVFYEQQ
jgi:hypothetical protein